jgi:hypothetical protein
MLLSSLQHQVFYIYAGICAGTTIYIWRLVPDLTGTSL